MMSTTNDISSTGATAQVREARRRPTAAPATPAALDRQRRQLDDRVQGGAQASRCRWRRAAGTPATGISAPPTSGPAIAPSDITVMLEGLRGRQLVERQQLRQDRAVRAGWFTAKHACCSAKMPSSNHTLFSPTRRLGAEQAAREDQPDRRDDQQGPAVEVVGERAAPQPEDDERHEAEQARQTRRTPTTR